MTNQIYRLKKRIKRLEAEKEYSNAIIKQYKIYLDAEEDRIKETEILYDDLQFNRDLLEFYEASMRDKTYKPQPLITEYFKKYKKY